MLVRSSFNKTVVAYGEGESSVTSSISLSGQRVCDDAEVDKAFGELSDSGMEYIYGPILHKLRLLSAEIPMRIVSAGLSPSQMGMAAAEAIKKVITEIKAELEMR